MRAEGRAAGGTLGLAPRCPERTHERDETTAQPERGVRALCWGAGGFLMDRSHVRGHCAGNKETPGGSLRREAEPRCCPAPVHRGPPWACGSSPEQSHGADCGSRRDRRPPAPAGDDGALRAEDSGSEVRRVARLAGDTAQESPRESSVARQPAPTSQQNGSSVSASESLKIAPLPGRRAMGRGIPAGSHGRGVQPAPRGVRTRCHLSGLRRTGHHSAWPQTPQLSVRLSVWVEW